MTFDVTSLSVKVVSDGITKATTDLKAFVEVADKAEKANVKLGTSAKGQADTDEKRAKATEAYMAKLQRQVDLLGANTSQTNSYTAAMKGMTALEQNMAAMLGAEVDAYKRLASEQSLAVKANKELDQSYSKLQKEADAYYASQKKIEQGRDVEMHNARQAALKAEADAYRKLQAEADRYYAAQAKAQSVGNSLNLTGQRQQQYKALSEAQSEAIRMNNAFDASIRRQQQTMQNRDIEQHNLSVRQYSQAHAEALKMNAAFDAQVKKNTGSLQSNNEAMREAHALARGLSGSLGALWMTYGALLPMAAGVAIGTSLKGIVTVGKDVENTLEGIRVKGVETIESVNKIRDSIMDLGKGIYGPQEVAKAFETLILAGLNAKQALSGISDALNLATVGGTTIEKSAYTLVQVGTALGYTAESYGRISDVIAMTAAVSMSSVETLSEAFKSGSVVGKLYGVTLVDIGTSLAALSQLGIQGSAAGTSLKNFYKELASSSEKVKATLKDMNLVPADFKDSEGKYLGLLQVVEKLATGLDGLKGNQQALAIANLSNERGMKTAVELLDLYRKKVEDTTKAGGEHKTMLEELRTKIEESYGFAAIGAAQMSLTVESQFKSVANTLKTVFLGAFQKVSPEISSVAERLKSAFNSPEFINAIQGLAIGFANITVALAENLPLLADFVKTMLLFKAMGFIAGLLTSVTTGIVALTTAIEASTVAAKVFQISLGLIGVSLMAAGAAYLYFTTQRDKSNLSTTQQTAIKYSEEYAVALEKEAKRLNEQLTLMKEGKDARDAETESMYRQQLAMAKMQGDKAKMEAENRLEKAGASVTVKDLEISDSIVKRGGLMTGAVKEFRAAQASLIEVNKKVDESFARTVAGQKAVMEAARAIEKERRRQEEANNPPSKGTGVLSGKTDTAGINDAFHKAIQEQQNIIDASNQSVSNYTRQQQSMFRAGEIGKLEMIENIGKKQVEASKINIAALMEQERLAGTQKNKTAAGERYSGKVAQEILDQAEREKQIAYDKSVVIQQYEDQTTKFRIKELEEQGNFAEAASLRWSNDYSAAYKAAQKDLEKFGATVPEVQRRIDQLDATKMAYRLSGEIKQAVSAFDALHGAAANLFKGLVADNAGLGIGGVFTAAMEASDKFAASLPDLQKKLADIKKLADANPSDLNAQKAYNEELSKMQGLANHQKTMWAEVGEAISKSLSSAFGNAGIAAGNFLQAVVKGDIVQTTLGEKRQAEIQEVWDKKLSMQQTLNELDKVQEKYAAKEAQARIKSYGDMAGAAKGFFKEGSNGYKVMADAEKAFRMLELAEALKAFVVKSGFLTSFLAVKTATDAAGAASTATYTMFEVAQAGLRAAAHGVVAVARAIASMPFPLNIVAGAATLAALIGFGVKMTGGGGGGGMSSKDRQEQAGTGTVLGDSTAKSESIAKSIEHLDKNSGLGLVHSQSMVNSLHNIEASMVGLSSLVVRGNLNTASVTGGVGKAQDLALKALSLDPLGSAGNKLLGGIGDRLLGNLVGTIFGGKVSVQDFGLNVNSTSMADVYANKLQANGYTDTKKSGGLFHSDSYGSTPSPVDPAVTQQISLILKGLGDSVKMAATSLGVTGADFEAHMNDFVAKIGKVSFKDLKGDEIQKQFAAIFSAIGDDMAKWAVNGLDKFTQTGEGALETLMRITNDFVQVGDVLSSVGQKFKVFGLEAVQLSEDFINLAGGLGKLTEGTKYLVDNIFTESEKLAPVAASLDAAMAALGFSYVKTIAQFDALIHAQDLNTVSGQQTYVALMNLAPAFKQVVDGAESAQKALYDEASKALGRLEDSINHEKSVAQAAYDAQIAIIKAQRSSAEKSFNDNKTVLNATIKTATEASSALKSLSSSLKQTLDSMYLVTQQAMRRDAAQALIAKALDIARSTGVLPKAEDLADALKTVASPADNLFSTFEDYARDMGITTNKISSLKDITDKEAAKQDTVLSVAQKQLLKLEDQYKLTTANFDAQEKAAKDVLDAETTRLDAILDNAKKQLEVANGTYQAVLKLPDALAAFKAALSGMYGSAGASTSGGGGGGAGPSVGTMATASPSKFGGTTYLPYNALYTPTPTNPADLASGKIWSEKDMGRAYMAAHTAANNFAFTPIDGSHADGLDYVPKDNYRANLHVGERVKTAKASRDEDSVADEIRQMRADLNAALLSIAQNTGKTAKVLDKFDGDGMPDVRTYTLA